MNAEKYQQVSSIFLQVCDAPEEKRPALLDAFCGDDAELRAEVAAMLLRDSQDEMHSLAVCELRESLENADPSTDRTWENDPAATCTERDQPLVPGFRILERIGEGGMGVVWQAIQLSTNREVALKLLKNRTFASPKLQTRFEREVELAARLQHPNIARVYDSRVSSDVSYYAMELVDGVELDEFVQSSGLDQAGQLRLMLSVCRAVQHAHGRGVIHRDLKPSNILVTAEGEPRIVDFGLARTLLDEETGQDSISLHDHLMGTPAFMSPEQASGRPDQIDTRSDVFSLGVILYRLLTKRSPHDLSGSTLSVIRRIAEEDARPPREVCRTIDPDLDALLMKALSRHQDERYGTAGEMAAEIERYLDGAPLLARPPRWTYILKKRLVKHRAAVAGVSLIVALLLFGVITYIVSINAEQQRTLAAHEVANVQRNAALKARDLAERWSTALRVQAADQALNATWRLTDGSEAERLLQLCPPRYRGWAWHRLNWMRDQSERSVGPFDEDVRQLLLTPDGSRLVAVLGTYSHGSDSRIVILDAVTFQELLTIRGHNGLIFRAAITPDSSQIYSGGRDQTLRRWNLATGQLIESLEVGTDVTDIGFTHDGRVIWADIRQGLTLQDTATGHRTAIELAGQHGQDYRLAVSADGRYVAWLTRQWGDGDVGYLQLVDLHTEQALWGRDVAGARKVLFAPDNESILVNLGGTIHQLDVATGADVVEWPKHHQFPISEMVLSPDQTRLASVGYHDQRIVLWEVESGQSISTFLGHTTQLYSIAFSQDGRRLVSGGDVLASPVMKVWDTVERGDAYTLFRHSGPAIAALSGDGESIVSLGSRQLALHSLPTGEQQWSIDFNLPDEFSGSLPALVHLAVTQAVPGRSGRVAVANAVPTEGGTATACQVTILDGASGATLADAQLPGIPTSLEFSHDTSFLALGVVETGEEDNAAGRVVILDVTDAQPIQSLDLPGPRGITSVAFSPDDQFVATAMNTDLFVWSLADNDVRRSTLFEGVQDVEWLEDGSLLVAFQVNEVHVIDPLTFDSQRAFHSREYLIQGASMSAAGKCVLIQKSSGEIQIFDSQLDVQSSSIGQRGPAPTTFQIAPDGRTIVTAHVDGSVRLWETASRDRSAHAATP